MSDHITARDVARKAKRILPLMGRLMESQMRSPILPVPPAHWHVLNHVDREPHTLGDLADKMSVSSASLSRTVTVLEERGWVTRNRSEEDRRVVLIETTDEGNDFLKSIEDRSEDFLTETLSKLPQDELNRLMDGLEIMIKTFADAMSYVPSDK